MSDDKIGKSWDKFFNPSTLKKNLIAASVFLSIYEIFKDSIISKLKGFFCHAYIDGKDVISKRYKEEVLSLDDDSFKAHLVWFYNCGVIDKLDIDTITMIREHRNDVAHRLPLIISEDGKEIELKYLNQIYSILSKIDRWWIVNIEMQINSDFDNIDLDEIDINEIKSGSMIFLPLLIKLAYGDDSGLKETYELFIENRDLFFPARPSAGK